MAEQIPHTIRDAQLAALDPAPGPVAASLHTGREPTDDMDGCTCAYTYRAGAWRQEIDRDCALHGGTIPSGGSIRVPRMEGWPAPWRAAGLAARHARYRAALEVLGHSSENTLGDGFWLAEYVDGVVEDALAPETLTTTLDEATARWEAIRDAPAAS